MIRRPLALLGCLVALGLAGPLAAQNLLSNSDFDAALGLAGWATGVGSWSPGPDSGSCSSSGSASGVSGTVGDFESLGTYTEACIPVDGTAIPTLWLGALTATDGAVWVRLALQFFSDPSCSAHLGYSDPAGAGPGPIPAWSAVQGEASVPSQTQGLRFWADMVPAAPGEPQFAGSFDRLYLGPEDPRDVIFADDFEADGGHACRSWTFVE